MKYAIQVILAALAICPVLGDISEAPIAKMKTKEVIRRLNEQKLSGIKNAPQGEVDSARMIVYLISHIAFDSKKHLEVHWSLMSKGWHPPDHKWKVSDYKNMTTREMLQYIVDRERWSFRISDGVVLIRQYIQ